MKTLLVPTLLTGALLLLAVALSLDLSSHFDSHISCGDFLHAKSGCRTPLGSSLSLVWGVIAALIGLIWISDPNL